MGQFYLVTLIFDNLQNISLGLFVLIHDHLREVLYTFLFTSNSEIFSISGQQTAFSRLVAGVVNCLVDNCFIGRSLFLKIWRNRDCLCLFVGIEHLIVPLHMGVNTFSAWCWRSYSKTKPVWTSFWWTMHHMLLSNQLLLLMKVVLMALLQSIIMKSLFRVLILVVETNQGVCFDQNSLLAWKTLLLILYVFRLTIN